MTDYRQGKRFTVMYSPSDQFPDRLARKLRGKTGRVCETPGCGNKLAALNPGRVCFLCSSGARKL